MSDNEWENDDVIEDLSINKKFDDEKEEIQKKKIEPVIDKPKYDDITSYEYKWRLKNKEKLDKQKETEEALKGLDEKERLKILEEKRKLDDLDDFLDIDKIDKKKVSKNEKLLETEKDFVDLAYKVSALLNANQKTPKKYQASFLKETLEQLAPMFDLKTINDFIKDLTKIFNETRNKESGKKAGKTKQKPKLAAGKGFDTVNSQPVKEYEYQDEYDDEYDYVDEESYTKK